MNVNAFSTFRSLRANALAVALRGTSEGVPHQGWHRGEFDAYRGKPECSECMLHASINTTHQTPVLHNSSISSMVSPIPRGPTPGEPLPPLTTSGFRICILDLETFS